MIPAKLKRDIMAMLKDKQIVTFVPGEKHFGTHPVSELLSLSRLVGGDRAQSIIIDETSNIEKGYNEEFGVRQIIHRNDADSVVLIVLRK